LIREGKGGGNNPISEINMLRRCGRIGYPPSNIVFQTLTRDGSDVSSSYTPLQSFIELSPRLPPYVMANISSKNFTSPTPIQRHALPLLMEGRDVVGLAPTGSGKTLAFVLPALRAPPRRSPSKKRCVPQCVVLCPTRELAQQTEQVFGAMLLDSSNDSHTVAVAYGGMDKSIQRLCLRGASIVVATPGRLLDFTMDGDVDLSEVQMVVVDEADEMLKMGFDKDVRAIMDEGPNRSQTVMFSATWTTKVRQISQEFLSPLHLMLSSGTHTSGTSLNPRIRQHVLVTQNKRESLRQVLTSPEVVAHQERVLVFANTKTRVEELAVSISQRECLRAEALHSEEICV